jgi:hypothetical protein
MTFRMLLQCYYDHQRTFCDGQHVLQRILRRAKSRFRFQCVLQLLCVHLVFTGVYMCVTYGISVLN